MRHLRLVQTLAIEGTLTAAGQHLFLSQSALSHQLKEIEDEIGVKLFRRVKKKMILTPAGQRVLDGADMVLGEIDRVKEDISRLTSGETGTLRVAACRYMSFRWLPAVLNSFKNTYPGVEISIDTAWDRDPTGRLLSGAVDLAITNSKCECAGAAHLKLFDDELVAVVRPDHRWASKKYITTRQFADEDLVAFEAEMNGMDFEASVLAPSGISPRSVITLPTIEAIVDMVRGGVGVAVLNTWPVRPFIDSAELRGVRLTRGGMKRAWYAVVADDDRNPPYIARFIGLLAHQGRA